MTKADQNLVERTLQSLMGSIVTGEFDSGLPPQEVLSVQLGVSRTVLREAIAKLEFSNILVSKPKVGMRVVPRNKWKILNPLVVESYFKDMPDHKRVLDMLVVFGDLGASAADSVSNCISRNLITPPEFSDTFLVQVDFQHWVFQESRNYITSEFAPLVRELLLTIAPLIDTTVTSPVMHHLRKIYWTTTGRYTLSVTNELYFAYESVKKVIEMDLRNPCAHAA